MSPAHTRNQQGLNVIPAFPINRQRGLSFNPSGWSARLPILALALTGFCVASYLAACQLGVVKTIWEPVFGNGSRKVLSSFISRMLPLPDAAIGALGYCLELVTGAIGGNERWRRLPWLVIIYGAIVGIIGATGIVLIFAQVFAIHAGCTLCLISAAISIVIAWLARHEAFASFTFLTRSDTAAPTNL